MEKERIYGLDLLRILSMCGIVGLHVIGQGGLINNANIYSFKYYIILLLYVIFFASVDVFGILSGYLNIQKQQVKSKRIIKLISIVLFWGVTISIICYGMNWFNLRKYGAKSFIFNSFPMLSGSYWYITSYIFLFFLIPYINLFCKKIDKEILKKLLIIIFVFLSIIPTIFLGKDLFKVLSGYSPFWLIYCYMIGAYIKLYGWSNNKKIFLKLLVVLCVTFTINAISRIIQMNMLGKIVVSDWFISYISPTTIIFSILSLNIFSNINIKNNMIKKVILYFSGTAFSVYIIHGNKIIFENVLNNLFLNLLNYNAIIIFLCIIGAILAIYFICCFADEIRKIIFKLFRINKLIDIIGDKLDKML